MKYLKYPKTYHLPWSLGVQSDDKIIPSLSCFEGNEIVITEKMDGENTNLYNNYIHARSIDSPFNFTRAWVFNMHAAISYLIPSDIHLSGENLWGEHSIRYEDGILDGYFYLFAAWKHVGDQIFALHYDEVVEYADKLDLPIPKVLYRGVFNEDKLKDIANNIDTSICEGYVVRNVNGFNINKMKQNVAKFVRKDHVQTSEHWLKNAKQNGKLKENCKPSFMCK